MYLCVRVCVCVCECVWVCVSVCEKKTNNNYYLTVNKHNKPVCMCVCVCVCVWVCVCVCVCVCVVVARQWLSACMVCFSVEGVGGNQNGTTTFTWSTTPQMPLLLHKSIFRKYSKGFSKNRLLQKKMADNSSEASNPTPKGSETCPLLGGIRPSDPSSRNASMCASVFILNATVRIRCGVVCVWCFVACMHLWSAINNIRFCLDLNFWRVQVLGAGLLTLPYAIMVSGIGWGFLLLLITFIGNLYCSKLLLDTAEAAKTHFYETLGAAAFPKYGSSMVAFCMILGKTSHASMHSLSSMQCNINIVLLLQAYLEDWQDIWYGYYDIVARL